MRVRRGSRGTFRAGHLIPSILALFWFNSGYITVLRLGMIHSGWLHLGRPDMKNYLLTRMWRLVTSPARYELFISPGQASGRLVFFFFFLSWSCLKLFPCQDKRRSLVNWFWLVNLWTKSWGVTIQMKPLLQYFHIVLFIIQHQIKLQIFLKFHFGHFRLWKG